MRSLLLAFPFLLPISLCAQAPTFQWAETVPNVPTDGSGVTTARAKAAPDGSVYAMTVVSGTQVIVGDQLINTQGDNRVVARYTEAGELLWAKSPGGWDIAVNGNDGVYAAGWFNGSMNFGGNTYTSNGYDAFLAKYGPNGEELWVRIMGGSGHDGSWSLALDGQGLVHVSGHFVGTATFGSTTLTATHAQSGFLALFDANGNQQWAVLAGGFDPPGSGDPLWNTLTCDAAGNTFLTGRFSGTSTFGTNATAITTTQAERQYLARFDAAGACTWATINGSSLGNIYAYIALTPAGNIYLYGWFKGAAASFGAGNTVYNAHPNNGQIYLALYNASGEGQWAVILTSAIFGSNPASLDVDDDGTAWITGDAGADDNTGLDNPVPVGGFMVIPDRCFIGTVSETGTVLNIANNVFLSSPGHTFGPVGEHIFYGTIYYITEVDPVSGATFASSLLDSYHGFVARFNADNSFSWLRYQGQHGQAGDAAFGVAMDATGNVYSTGAFFTTAIVCDDTLRAPIESTHFWVNKRDAGGECIWTRQVRCSAPLNINQLNYAQALALAPNGDLLLTGRFYGSIDFGTVQLTSAGDADLFVARFDADGNCLWAVRGGGTDEDHGAALAVASNGDAIVSGQFSGTASIAGSALNSAGMRDGFVARYSASGAGLWCNAFGGAGDDIGLGVALDASGNAYTTGYFSGGASFGSTTLTGTGTEDLFVAKYSAAGNAVWAVGSTGIGRKHAKCIARGPDDRLYVAGEYSGEFNFGSSIFTGAAVDYNAFLACLDLNGASVWEKNLPTTEIASAAAIAVRPGGEILLTGSFTGTLVTGTSTANSIGGPSAWMAAFDPDGNDVWLHTMHGSAATDYGGGLAMAADANTIHVAGYFGNLLFLVFAQTGCTFSFDPGNPSADRFALNSLDAFVAKYAVEQTVGVQTPGSSAMNLTIAPNPVDRFFAITSNVPFDPRTRVVVRDALGRAMHVPFNLKQGSIEVDASALTSGAYTITVADNKAQHSERFVKE